MVEKLIFTFPTSLATFVSTIVFFLFWVPFIFRMLLVLFGNIVYNSYLNKKTNFENLLREPLLFYYKHFESIREDLLIDKTKSNNSDDSENDEDDFFSKFKINKEAIRKLSIHFLWAISFFGTFLLCFKQIMLYGFLILLIFSFVSFFVTMLYPLDSKYLDEFIFFVGVLTSIMTYCCLILTLLFWSIFGLLLWIPLFVWSLAFYCGSVFLKTFMSIDMTYVKKYYDFAFNFYRKEFYNLLNINFSGAAFSIKTNAIYYFIINMLWFSLFWFLVVIYVVWGLK